MGKISINVNSAKQIKIIITSLMFYHFLFIINFYVVIYTFIYVQKKKKQKFAFYIFLIKKLLKQMSLILFDFPSCFSYCNKKKRKIRKVKYYTIT